jgi:hypothetical protein
MGAPRDYRLPPWPESSAARIGARKAGSICLRQSRRQPHVISVRRAQTDGRLDEQTVIIVIIASPPAITALEVGHNSGVALTTRMRGKSRRRRFCDAA